MKEGSDDGELRELAKKRLKGKPSVQATSSKNASELIEDLSVHQEELNIQNEELLRVQKELEIARAKYFELYDLAPVGYITVTPELMLKEANLKASNLLGIDRKNLFKRGLSSFISPSSQESFYLHYRRLTEGNNKQVGMFQVRSKKGEELCIQFESNLVEEGSSTGFRSILTDVTELKRTERSMKESEARFRTQFENSYDAVLLTRPDGSILSANPAASRMFGMTEEEIIKAGRAGLVVENETLEHAVREREKNGKARAELTLKRKDGTTFVGETTSNSFPDAEGGIKTSMIIRDVTERKMMEDALSYNEILFRSFVEQSTDGFAIVNTSGKIVEWNMALERISGRSRASVLDHFVWDVQITMLTDERRESFGIEDLRDLFINALETGKATFLL